MSAPRVCSECSASLAGRSSVTKTCSPACRAKRSRRIKRVRVANLATDNRWPEGEEVREAVTAEFTPGNAESITKQVIEDEIRPVVREAITEDIFKAIEKMVRLTPAAVNALEEQLASDDEAVKHRAATLVIKYTMGHPALVRPEDADANQQLVVNFNLPRPDTVESPELDEGVEDAEAIELRTCDACGEEKPVDQFVANSDRCTTCFEVRRQEVLTRFGD